MRWNEAKSIGWSLVVSSICFAAFHFPGIVALLIFLTGCICLAIGAAIDAATIGQQDGGK